MAKYECVCIIRTDIGEEQIKAVVDYIGQTLQRHGAEITKTDLWGNRRMAYEINKQRDGYYVLFELLMPPAGAEVTEMRRVFKANESILRTVFVRIPPIADKAKKLAEERKKQLAEKAAREAAEAEARAAAEAEALAAKEAEEAEAAAQAAAAAPAEDADAAAIPEPEPTAPPAPAAPAE